METSTDDATSATILEPHHIAIMAQMEAAINASPPYPSNFSSRGITICAGGRKYFTNAWVLVRMLRELGCRLPIQIWHFGADELDGAMESLVKPYNVECIDAKAFANQRSIELGNGWPLKPFAIIHSPYKEVLALDADNLPVVDPEYLFDDAEYRETGAIFWPDISRTGKNRIIWDVMAVPYRDEPEFESGQIVVNKEICWAPLQLTMWMNQHSAFFYELIWGDKDTFRFAWHKLGHRFSMPGRGVEMLTIRGSALHRGVLRPYNLNCGVMCQHDMDGDRVFQHRNMYKWTLYGENPRIPGFLHEADCRRFRDDLRKSWSGRIGPAKSPSQSAAIAAARNELFGETWLYQPREWYLPDSAFTDVSAAVVGPVTPGGDPSIAIRLTADEEMNSRPDKAVAPVGECQPRTLEELSCGAPDDEVAWQELHFDEDGTFGRSADDALMFWELFEADDEVVLKISSSARVVTYLRRESRGTWSGLWLHGNSMFMRDKKHGAWFGPWLNGKPNESFRLCSLKTVFPMALSGNGDGFGGGGKSGHEPQGQDTGAAAVPPLRHRSVLHVCNSAFGIGDHITTLYACAGAADAGSEVIFYTPYYPWFERVSHPHLTIREFRPPSPSEAASASKKAPPSPREIRQMLELAIARENGGASAESISVVDVNRHYNAQLRYAEDKASWYASSIVQGVVPRRPWKVDRQLKCRRLDFRKYILLAPCAAVSVRDWPAAHWRRLCSLLSEAGFEVVAIGLERNTERLVEICNETWAFWAIGQEPEWVMDAMLGSVAVIAQDSGLAHVAGLLRIPTIAIHAHLPPRMLFSMTDVISATPETDCTFCRWRPDRGFLTSCASGCSALATIGPEQVMKLVRKICARQGSDEFGDLTPILS